MFGDVQIEFHTRPGTIRDSTSFQVLGGYSAMSLAISNHCWFHIIIPPEEQFLNAAICGAFLSGC